ncbi:MAG TPA: NUDIX hydrolase [Polyangia bacterium]
MPKPWIVRGSETLLSTRIFDLDSEQCESPRTGAVHDFYVLRGPDWCNIIPITDGGDVVMIRQYRYGSREITLEVPGGMVDATDASPLEAARRELLEETGYAARAIEPIGSIRPNPAIQSNTCHSFVARGAHLVAPPHFDSTEDIDVVLVPLAEIPARVARGEITHCLVVVAYAYLLGLAPPPAP